MLSEMTVARESLYSQMFFSCDETLIENYLNWFSYIVS